MQCVGMTREAKPCARKGTILHNGKWWCSVHSPVAPPSKEGYVLPYQSATALSIGRFLEWCRLKMIEEGKGI